MPDVRVLVVDDEPHARRGIARLVGGTPGFLVVCEAGNGAEALAAIKSGGIDVLVIDVQMPGMSGLEVVRAAPPDKRPVIVFVTAHEVYAVGAFDVEAVDYVLKPFTEERFARALTRARAALRAPDAARFVVVRAGRRLIVPANEVEWISGAGYYSRLHAGERTYLVRETLQAIERRLPAGSFLRVHRSGIVRADMIREIRRLEQGAAVVVLANGTRVRLSRSHRGAIADLLASGTGSRSLSP